MSTSDKAKWIIGSILLGVFLAGILSIPILHKMKKSATEDRVSDITNDLNKLCIETRQINMLLYNNAIDQLKKDNYELEVTVYDVDKEIVYTEKIKENIKLKSNENIVIVAKNNKDKKEKVKAGIIK